MPGDREPAPQAWWARPESTGPGSDDAAPYVNHPAADWPGPTPTSRARTITPASTQRRAPVNRPPARGPGRAPAFGDQRGLTAVGATVVVLVLATLGAVVDVTTGTGLRTVFTIAFVVAAAMAAATVHNEDLLASVVLVPLVFAPVASVSGVVEGSGLGSLLKVVEGVAITMVNAAPALMIATLVAAVIAGVRGVSNRRVGRSSRGSAGRAHA